MPFPGSNKPRTPLLLAAGEFFLRTGGGAGEDAEDFIFLHDDELFAVDLDLGAGVLAEQDAVALMDGQGEGLAFVVGAAFAGGNDFSLLRLVFGRVGNDDAAAGGGSFLHTTYQNAVMERCKLRHDLNSFQVVGS